MIQENCYWYINEELPPDQQTMLAMCVDCNKDKNTGWFWHGKASGYGDYDLYCSICKRTIYERENNADKDQD